MCPLARFHGSGALLRWSYGVGRIIPENPSVGTMMGCQHGITPENPSVGTMARVSAWDNSWKSLCGHHDGVSVRGNDQQASSWSSSTSDMLAKLGFAVWLFSQVQGYWVRMEIPWGCSPKSWLLAACLNKWTLQSHAQYPSLCQFPPTNISTCLII